MKRTLIYSAVISVITVQGYALAGSSGKIGAYDFSYQIDNGRGVTQAFDDGQRTYLQLRAGVSNPIVYQVNGASKRQIDVTTNGVITVIPATGKNFIVEINGDPVKVTYTGVGIKGDVSLPTQVAAPAAAPAQAEKQSAGQGAGIAVMTGRFSVSGASSATSEPTNIATGRIAARTAVAVKAEEPAAAPVDKSWVYSTGHGDIIKTGGMGTPKRGDGPDPTLTSTSKEYPLPFAFGKPGLGPKGKEVISKVLADAPNSTSLTVSVPMDGKGSDWRLANERTQNVKAALLKGGIKIQVVANPVPGKNAAGVSFGSIVLSYTTHSKMAALPPEVQKAGEVQLPMPYDWLSKEVGPDAAQAAQEVVRLAAAGTISAEDAADMLEKIVTLPVQRSKVPEVMKASQQSRPSSAPMPTTAPTSGFTQPPTKRTGIFKVERTEPVPVMVAAAEPKIETPKPASVQEKPRQQNLVFSKGEVDGTELSAYVRKNGLQAAYVIRAANFSTVFSTREQLAAMGVKKIITNVDSESGKTLSINAVSNKYGM